MPPNTADTSRSLVLLRHAKSSWDDPTLADHDRPLAPRGEKALRRLRRYVTSRGLTADLVLCSTAARTVATWQGVQAAFGPDAEVLFERHLYAAPAGQLLDRLRRVDDGVARVLMIGHNPGIHALAVSLAGTGAPELLGAIRTAYPTGAMASFSLTGAWADLGPGTANLDGFVVPRELG